MKKFLVLAGISVLLFLGSCASVSNEAFDFAESLPDSEIAVINWNGMHITEYNGIKVKWDVSALGWLTIKIPGGDTKFILNGQVGSKNVGWTVFENMPFSFNFEKGKEYTVRVLLRSISVFSGKSVSEKDRIALFDLSEIATIETVYLK